jgi:3-methyladenine DNA glycosylase AlkD
LHREPNIRDKTARAILAELAKLYGANVPTLRALRRRYTREAASLSGQDVFRIADQIVEEGAPRHHFVGFELVRCHPAAFSLMNRSRLERLGRRLSSWDTVDGFATILSGTAWREGLISDATVRAWSKSSDRWWRRTSLVSTVPLNVKTQGGIGDPERTLDICARHIADHDDMIVKALSWALRALSVTKPQPVRKFIRDHELELAPRVLREVRAKLDTGLKNPNRAK